MVQIKRLSKESLAEFVELIRLFEEVFEMKNFSMPNPDYLQNTLSSDNFCVFVAITDGKVVGGLTAYELQQYYSVKPVAYIYDLAVAVNFQRNKIGSKLITEVYNFYRDKGFEEVFVQADRADDYVIDFYRKMKPSEDEEIAYFSYKLN